MKFLAFDQSVRSTGWALGDDTFIRPVIEFGHFGAPKRDDLGERVAILRDSAMPLIKRTQPELIVIEAVPFMGGKIGVFSQKVTAMLYGVSTVFKMIAYDCGVPLVEVTSQEWRKTFLGFGRAPKGEDSKYMKRAAIAKCNLLGYATTKDDEADAIGIAYWIMFGPPADARRQESLFDKAVESRL